MSELPNGWATTNLGEILSLRGEKVDPSSMPEAPFIGLEDIEPHTSRILKTGVGADVKSSTARFYSGDVLYSRLRPYLNKVTIPEFDGLASAEVLVLQPTPAVEAEFLRRKIMSREFLDFSAMLDKGDRPRVNFKEIAQFHVALPPHKEQKRIVAKVDDLTVRTARARKELDRIPTLIARYKQRLLALAAEGILTSGWRKENHQSKWRIASISEVAQTTFDGPFGSNLKSEDYADYGVRVVRLENIGNLRFIREKETFIPIEKFQTLRRHELLPRDVLFSSFISEDIRVCTLPEDLETIAINKADCFCIRVDQSVCSPEFLSFLLASPSTFEVLKEAVHGATRPRVSLTQLKKFKFRLPSINEQVEIVRRIETAFAWLDRLAMEHKSATKLLPKLDAAILTKAFRGELVPQDPNDEPASVLLERVKAQKATVSANVRGADFKIGLGLRGGKPSIKPNDSKVQPSHSASSKQKREHSMKRSLESVLVGRTNWISGQAAFSECGFESSAATQDIEQFYSELRNLLLSGKIEQRPIHNEHGLKIQDELRWKRA
jgi:type I restriction enzyme S subunit